MPEEIKKQKGGQPGNHNALKHGRYMSKKNIHLVHTTADDQLDTLDHLIVAIKKTMEYTYQVGLKAETTQEINKTLNSLSLASYGLCRMLNIRDRLLDPPQYPDLPGEYNELLELFIDSFAEQSKGNAIHP